MTTEQLARSLRTKNKSIVNDYTKLHKKEKALEKACEECKHKHVIIVNSAYSGSSSWDYDDAHGELRLCLVCGKHECHDKRDDFKYLLNPFVRFEEGGKNRKRLFDDPLNQTLASLIKYCKREGYKV